MGSASPRVAKPCCQAVGRASTPPGYERGGLFESFAPASRRAHRVLDKAVAEAESRDLWRALGCPLFRRQCERGPRRAKPVRERQRFAAGVSSKFAATPTCATASGHADGNASCSLGEQSSCGNSGPSLTKMLGIIPS
jgi:hypothetical protein